MAFMATLQCIDLGHCAFAPALDLQRLLVRRVQADGWQAYLVLVEHDPPVITLGVSADNRNILASPEELEAAGIAVHHTRRGGDVTYHGPGQLVGYPIFRLTLRRQSLRRYLRDIEQALIAAVGRLGVEAKRRRGLPGVWVGRRKLAAIGVAVSRWVTYHGFALNVSPDLAHFDLIVPCGLTGSGVTSLAELLGAPPEMGRVRMLVAQALAEVFSFAEIRWTPPEQARGACHRLDRLSPGR